MTRQAHNAKALTLLEVVLAVTMTVALMGAVFWLYDQALTIRRGVLRQTELAGASHRVMDRLTHELRGAMPSRFLNLSVDGATDRISFLTARVPGPAAWTEPSLSEAPPPAEYDMQLVTYRLRTETDDSGVVQVLGLERVLQKMPSAQTVEEEDLQTALIAPAVKFLRVRYWNGSEWASSWGATTMPPAVEIALGAVPLEEGVASEDYSHELFTRVIALPVTPRSGPSGGAVISGGPTG